MVTDKNKYLIPILAIFIFAFLYRCLLMTHGTYPAGADVGLHNSVVHSIINQNGNVDFLYNYYQMGGGLSLTFPGYHIFVAQIMILTGMSEYLVHTLSVSLISAVIVLVSYLITRTVWKESTAIIVAFLMAISRFDIEMLLWGGYPNVVTLMLIPLTFYLYIQKNRFTKLPFYLTTSLLIGSIFLSHSLSCLVFISILFSVILFGLLFGQKIGTTRFETLSWLLPVIFGALIVSPYLIQIVPAYLTNTTNAAINQATAATRILPLNIVLPLFAVTGLYFLLSKKYLKKYFTLPTVLLALWLLIPAVFTQVYLVGLYTDFNRFLYFAILPLLILIGLFIDLGSDFFADILVTHCKFINQIKNTIKGTEPITHKRLVNFSKKINQYFTRPNLYAVFIIGLLLVCFITPLFTAPTEGLKHQTFYQLMNDPLYDAMEWIKTNTVDSATFVTEAYYGWWLAGFAQRSTWSAVDPQFLSLSREFSIAQVATNLLDADYIFGSSFNFSNEIHSIQVREDGGYMAGNNPQIFASLNWTYAPYPVFNFNSNSTKILYEVNGTPKSVTLEMLPVIAMYMENNTQYTKVAIIRGNEYFTHTQLTTVYQGSRFVNITIMIEAVDDNVSLSWLQSTLAVNAVSVGSARTNTIGFLAEGVKVFGQIVFNKNVPEVNSKSYFKEYTEVYLDYNLEGKKQAEIQLSLTAYSVTNNAALYQNAQTVNDFFNDQINFNLEPEIRSDLPLLEPFDYQAELKINKINYIAVTRNYEEANASTKLKFANDPLFNLVFINHEVAIFEVNS
ncbi:MAG: hypothetical protein FWH37_00600 [Candidatus Bathyarchaeota archaeon]|nr:hypothetical protein [Candidatus Termiticorpusculum sp.]